MWPSQFAISDPPSSKANDDLLQDLILQAESLPKKVDPKATTYATGVTLEALFNPLKHTETYNDWLTVFHARMNDLHSLEDLRAAIHTLRDKSARLIPIDFAMTVVVMPPSTSKTSKRSAQPYGAYDLPLEARQEKTEAPISLSSTQPSSSPHTAKVDTEHTATILQGNNTSPVLGILPPFFSTEEACFKQTHNCSGHGHCIKSRNGTEGKDGIPDRWKCQCKPTVLNVGETGMEVKHKTTHWGGPACQKKDVSQPFWLFVASGILFAFLISAGIGLLYSVGSEELPSVIGAGVSGPARK
jgi:hypothetical protein